MWSTLSSLLLQHPQQVISNTAIEANAAQIIAAPRQVFQHLDQIGARHVVREFSQVARL
jgi:hypothetical protein